MKANKRKHMALAASHLSARRLGVALCVWQATALAAAERRCQAEALHAMHAAPLLSRCIEQWRQHATHREVVRVIFLVVPFSDCWLLSTLCQCYCTVEQCHYMRTLHICTVQYTNFHVPVS